MFGVVKVAGASGRPASASAQPGTAEPHQALAASRRQLATALRQIDVLQAQTSCLEQEVSSLRNAVAQARQFAHHDELTGLPNRTLLLDHFKQAAARAERQRKQIALLFLDVDGFKNINDTLGHTAGDGLLQQVAARLVACIRTSDTACRYGGDEFVILLPEFEDRAGAIAAAEKVRAHLASPFLINGVVINMTTSVGIAFFPDDGKECSDLIHVSDLAMYRNKGRSPAPRGILASGSDG
jgi:diguanylate cyclase (GGDEF)-like protein